MVNGNLYKIGKADLNRVTKSSVLPTRLHQQLRTLRKAFGKENVVGKVVEDLGDTTTAHAKTVETARLKAVYDKTGNILPGSERSFKP